MDPEPAVPQVLAHLGISPHSLKSVSPLVSGAGRHQGFRARTDRGEWVVKRHRGADIQRLSRSHRLESRLAEVGFPVAPLCRSDSGESLIEEGAAHYSVHGWVEGTQISIGHRAELIDRRPTIVGEFAGMVGTLHRISRSLDDGSEDLHTDLHRLLRSPMLGLRALRRPRRSVLSRWQVLRLRRNKSDFDRWIIRVLPDIAGRADRLASQAVAHRFEGSDMGLIHNDINWENLIFDEGLAVRALLDFDNAARAPWAVEVGSAAVVLVGAEPQLVSEFVEAYEDSSQIRIDHDLVQLAMEMRCVRAIVTSVVTYLDGNADLTLRAPWCYHMYDSLQMLNHH